MRISDWSSDVCSSDLKIGHSHARALANQPFYHGFANAAAAASHDCYLARQTIHYLLSRLSLFQHIAPLHFGQRLWRYEAASDKDDLSNERWRITSMACFRFQGLVPVIDPTSFVHPSASLIGDVIVGAGCYIGAGASLRGDFGRIVEIGRAHV